MRYRYLFPIACGVVLLAGCTSESHYAQVVRSWHGASTHALFRRWGYPNRIARLPNGRRLLIYRKIKRGHIPLHGTPGYTGVTVQNSKPLISRVPATAIGGVSYDLTCTTWFKVNKEKRIVSTRFRGNNCVASSSFGDKHMHSK